MQSAEMGACWGCLITAEQSGGLGGCDAQGQTTQTYVDLGRAFQIVLIKWEVTEALRASMTQASMLPNYRGHHLH